MNLLTYEALRCIRRKIFTSLIVIGLSGIVAVVGGEVATAAPYREEPVEIGEPTSFGHKKGNPTFREHVIVPSGTNHVCEGRKLLYQGHLDTIYVTRNKQLEPNGTMSNLTVMTVDGRDVVPADFVCTRLAPDASDGQGYSAPPKGTELSRLVVPDNKSYSFLGQPGDIVWHAPQHVTWTQRPLWSGIGAFDPNHELDGNVPVDFVNNEVNLDLVDFEGPGRVSIFFSKLEQVEVNFSVAPGDELASLERPGSGKTFKRSSGSHGHYSWAFSEPGIYRMTWRPWAEKTDGTMELGQPAETVWLVGSDEQVGLPEGTTTGLLEITKPAEEIRKEMGFGGSEDGSGAEDGKPSDDEKENGDEHSSSSSSASSSAPSTIASASSTTKPANPNSENSGSTSTPDQPAEPPAEHESKPGEEAEAWWKGEKLHIVRSGHMDLALLDKDGHRKTALFDDEDPQNRVERESGTFAFALNDEHTKLKAPEKWRNAIGGVPEDGFLLPMGGDKQQVAPWLGFSTEHIDYSTLQKGSAVSLRLAEFSGPGRMVAGHDGLWGPKVTLDSADLSKTHTYPERAHDHQFFWFTRPGLYRTVFRYEWTDVNGENQHEDLTAYILAGDEAIAAAGNYASNPEEQPTTPAEPTTEPSEPSASTSETTAPSKTSEKPKPTTTTKTAQPTKTEQPTKNTEPPAHNDSKPAPEAEAWWKGSKPHIIRHGHMDLALVDRNGLRMTMLFDDENPRKRVERASGTFAFALSDQQTKVTAPEKWRNRLGGIPAEGYYLPEATNKSDVAPWLGFSTEKVSYETLQPGSGVRLSISEFSGPGRLITGHEGGFDGIHISLDSNDLSKSHLYPDRAHDHQFFWFTRPGLYRSVFRYEWTDLSGKRQSEDLVSYFLVGDQAISAGENYTPRPGSGNSQQPTIPEDNGNNDGASNGNGDGAGGSRPGGSGGHHGNGGAVPPLAGNKPSGNNPGSNKPGGGQSAGTPITPGQGGSSGQGGSGSKAGGPLPPAQSSANGGGANGGSAGSGRAAPGGASVSKSGGVAAGNSAARAGGAAPAARAGGAAHSGSANKSAQRSASARPSGSNATKQNAGTRIAQGNGHKTDAKDAEDVSLFKRAANMIKSSGWLGGLLLGLGLMGIVGGLLFFLSTREEDDMGQPPF